LLPSISSLVDEDVVHRREMFLEIAERVEAVASELELMNVRAAPAEVIKFMTMFAERRGFNLPEPALLVMDAHSVAEIIPADLFKLACRRLWAEFRYRRLPEPPDFTQAVSEEIAERREAAARVRSVALKIETAKMYEELDARSRERHTFNKAAEYKRENARQAAQRDNSKFDTVVVSNPALGKGKAPLQAMPDLALDVEIDDSGRCPTQCGRAVLTQQDDQWSCQRDNMMDDCSDRATVDIGTDDATLNGSMVTLLLLFTAYRISYSRPGCTAHLLWENRNKHSFSHFEEGWRRTSQNNNSSYLEGLQLLPLIFNCKNNEGKVLAGLSIDGIAVQADYLAVLAFRHPFRYLATCCVDHNGSIAPASTSYPINITDEHNLVPVQQSNLDNVAPMAGIIILRQCRQSLALLAPGHTARDPAQGGRPWLRARSRPLHRRERQRLDPQQQTPRSPPRPLRRRYPVPAHHRLHLRHRQQTGRFMTTAS
jgi:hypothetical protein